VNWGILGTGNIARKFAKDLLQAPNQKLVAVGSRSAETADAFGQEFNIPPAKRHRTYESFLSDPDVHAVYVSLPNHLHKEWTIKLAQAKKHILCEKPFCTNMREADDAFEAVKASGVFFMEAFMYRCHPQTFKIREILKSGAIGEVRLIHAHFCYNMGPQYTNVRMSNPRAGGGIMDVGCYTVSMARLAAGCEPVEAKACAHVGSISRVDEQATMTLRFPTGAVAALSCATQVGADTFATIYGSEGSLHVPVPWFPAPREAKLILKSKGKTEEIVIDAGLPLYAVEAVHVAEHLKNKQAPAMTWADTLGNQRTLDMLRASIGLKFDNEGSGVGGQESGTTQ
jgi:predicted dehydrogenase